MNSAGSSDVRLNTERIDAAARIIFSVTALDTDLSRSLAEAVLRKADSAVPGSWNDTERLRTAILDIDAHATPLGEDDNGFVTTGYLVSVGALHRALGLVGHTSQRADDTPVSSMREFRERFFPDEVRLDALAALSPEQLGELLAIEAVSNALDRALATSVPSPPPEGQK